MSQLQEQTRQATGGQDFALSDVSGNDFTGVARVAANEDQAADPSGKVVVLRRGLQGNSPKASGSPMRDDDLRYELTQDGFAGATDVVHRREAGTAAEAQDQARLRQLAQGQPVAEEDDPDDEDGHAKHFAAEDGPLIVGAGLFAGLRRHLHWPRRPKRKGKEKKGDEDDAKKKKTGEDETAEKKGNEAKTEKAGEAGPEAKTGVRAADDAGEASRLAKGADAGRDAALIAREAQAAGRIAREGEAVAGAATEGYRLLRAGRTIAVGIGAVAGITAGVAFGVLGGLALGALVFAGVVAVGVAAVGIGAALLSGKSGWDAVGHGLKAAAKWGFATLVPPQAQQEFNQGWNNISSGQNIGTGIVQIAKATGRVLFLDTIYHAAKDSINYVQKNGIQKTLETVGRGIAAVPQYIGDGINWLTKNFKPIVASVGEIFGNEKVRTAAATAVDAGLTGDPNAKAAGQQFAQAAARDPLLLTQMSNITFDAPQMPRGKAKPDDQDIEPARPVAVASNAPVAADTL